MESAFIVSKWCTQLTKSRKDNEFRIKAKDLSHIPQDKYGDHSNIGTEYSCLELGCTRWFDTNDVNQKI
ncbi:unnamed protein product (macronuclear) [Paramecium tetraurelia]|uniref:Uncharacterized protein n=1 Tax=Paramecium tetraurelia TaxID=5888 RepID=A0E0Z8_PARTE|nr:uncharacterized protein GSPATT00022134001 [Paramecium tetraurelia]CAK88965.1 unnamed protein product [Paramecium tetraurelia]|eukprot:XP_001456362.1 hypothetical protein (macronuclear) [Paramecium tetraurelia strain d4-2]